MTTGAYKIAGGVELPGSSAPTSRLAKQSSIPSIFVSKITKAFLDTLYAFLDGLVHLASDESPGLENRLPNADIAELTITDSLELLDIHNAVRGLALATWLYRIRTELSKCRTLGCCWSYLISAISRDLLSPVCSMNSKALLERLCKTISRYAPHDDEPTRTAHDNDLSVRLSVPLFRNWTKRCLVPTLSRSPRSYRASSVQAYWMVR